MPILLPEVLPRTSVPLLAAKQEIEHRQLPHKPHVPLEDYQSSAQHFVSLERQDRCREAVW